MAHSRNEESGRAAAGQPVGQLVDRDFVLERMAALQLDRREMAARAGRLVSPRTLQRVVNTPGVRLSLTSAAAIAEVLECGSRDVLVPAAPVGARIASFGLSPHPPFAESFGTEPGGRRWIARAEEASILEGLSARRPVLVHGAARCGKTSLARRIADRLSARYARGAIWIDGDLDPDRARGAVAECLGLFHPFPLDGRLPEVLDERFARALWSRRRLLVVDDARDGSRVLRLLGRYRGPMDLLVLTDREQAAVELERLVGRPPVHLAPLGDAQVLAWLLLRHPGDERLAAGGALDDGARAALPGALAGEAAALALVARAAARATGAEPGWRALLEAVAGRPDAMDFASDQLRLTRLATLAEIAERVACSESVNSPLLGRVSPGARRFFLRVGALDGLAVPLDWAAAAADVAPDRARLLCDELALLLQHHEGDRGLRLVAIRPHLRRFAVSALSDDERAAAEHGLLRKARDEARRIGSLPPREAMGALRAAEPLFLLVLGRVDVPEAAEAAARARLALEILSPLRHLLPGWRTEALEPALVAALESPANELLVEAHQLRLATGRWLMSARADHGRAETLFGAAAEGFARLGRQLEAADARIEQGIALFSTRRGGEALPVFREAVALARLGQAPVDVLARQLVNVAFAETRRRAGRDHRAGWRSALALLDEATALLRRAGGDEAAPLPRIVALDRAVVQHVLGRAGWRRSLEAALRALLEITPPDDVFGAYLLATATGARIVLEGSLAAQRRRTRELWWSALRLRGFAVGDTLRRLGQLTYYLNGARAPAHPADADIRLVNEGTMVTDPPLPMVARYGASIATMFLVEPLREVFDRAFLDAMERFVWELGGPNQGRTLEEIERLQASQPPVTARASARP